ncbi:MAG: hypothetical protein WD355_03480 [Balneolaceae bacterium]
MVTLFLVTFKVMNQLTVFEKYSRHWPAVAIGSAAVSLILFGIYLYTDAPLAEGYLRLAAFIFFALSLLTLFKWKDGRMEIRFSIEEGSLLHIRYLVRNKPVADESFDLADFLSVKKDSMPNRSMYDDFSASDHTIRIQRKDNGEWIYLNDVHGRVIPLHRETAGQVEEFLKTRAGLGQSPEDETMAL